MKKLWDSFDPVVIDDALIRRCIVLPDQSGPTGSTSGTQGAAARSKAARGQQAVSGAAMEMPYKAVAHLRFSFLGISRIDNLVGFGSLKRLQLDNNNISKIENLSHIVTLESLDLSFNKIKKIEGLEGLTRLQDLSLASNQLETIDHLEAQIPTLQTLSLGGNQIASLSKLRYLRQFKKLSIVGFAGNPIPQEDYESFLLALVESLRYVDYRLVDQTRRKAARERHAEELRELVSDEERAKNARAEEAEQEQYQQLLREADLAGVNTLFADMIKGDQDLAAVAVLPQIQDAREEYENKFRSQSEDFKKNMLEFHKQRLDQHAAFVVACNKAAESNNGTSVKAVEDFNKALKRALEAAGSAQGNAAAFQAAAAELNRLRTSCNTVFEALLENEVFMSEQIEVFTREFDKQMSDIDATIVAATQAFFSRIRDAESLFHDRVMQTALSEYEALRNNPGLEVSDAARAFLADRDTLLNHVNGSHDFQLTQIDALLDEMKKHELSTREKFVSDARSEEAQRNRDRCSEIWQLQQRTLERIDKALAHAPAGKK
eukprot:m51a1_g5579 hypothetical protein (547) ;mRNA; f:625331-627385